jgi:hypothetical protein
MAKGVLITADIWASYLTEEEAAVQMVDELIGSGKARATEAGGAEAIRRCETMEQTAVMRELLVDLPPVDEGRAIWVRAGELAFRMKIEGSGQEIGLLEAHEALVAHKNKLEVLTADPGTESSARYLGLVVRTP